MLDYFGDRNLIPGRWLRVREVRALDGVVIVEDEEAEVYALGSRWRVRSSSRTTDSLALVLK